MSVVQVIGAVSGLLSIFHFFQEQFHNAGDSSIGYSFKVGLDGAGGGLSNAGGNIPDIRAYNEHGELIGKKINDKTYCGPGDDNCLSQINKVHQQPTYTLFSGNNDAICIAWVSVTFPGQDKYAWIGNWGQQCGAAWYYSDIYVQSDQGAEKVLCTWVDGNGDVPTTGFQVHWPEYKKGWAANNNDTQYYCNNKPVLDFRLDHDPDNIVHWTRKRDMFSTSPSTAVSRATHNDEGQATHIERLRKSQARDDRLIKSKAAGHAATDLCNSKSSIGPSFVSHSERKFCDMKAKTLYPFCEDVESGHCWDDDSDSILAKGNGIGNEMAAAPIVKFGNTINWGEE